MKKSGNLCALVLIPTAVDGRPFHVSGGARTTQTSHSVASNYLIQTSSFELFVLWITKGAKVLEEIVLNLNLHVVWLPQYSMPLK